MLSITGISKMSFAAQKISLSDYMIILGKSANEINAAGAARTIALSNPYFGVLSRGYQLCLPYILPGIRKAYRYSFQERLDAVRYGTTPPDLADVYNRAALRHTTLLKNGEGVYPNPILVGFYSALHTIVFYGFQVLMPMTLFVMLIDRSMTTRIHSMFLLMLGSFAARCLYYGLLDASLYRATVNYLNANFVLVYFLMLGASLIIYAPLSDVIGFICIALPKEALSNVAFSTAGDICKRSDLSVASLAVV